MQEAHALGHTLHLHFDLLITLDLINYDSFQRAQKEDIKIQGNFDFVIRQCQVALTLMTELFIWQPLTS